MAEPVTIWNQKFEKAKIRSFKNRYQFSDIDLINYDEQLPFVEGENYTVVFLTDEYLQKRAVDTILDHMLQKVDSMIEKLS